MHFILHRFFIKYVHFNGGECFEEFGDSFAAILDNLCKKTLKCYVWKLFVYLVMVFVKIFNPQVKSYSPIFLPYSSITKIIVIP